MENGQQERKEGWERELLEKLAFASLEESRKARRWGLFFKIFIAVYLVIALLIVWTRRIHALQRIMPAP